MAYKFFIPGVSISEAFMAMSLFFHILYGTFWKSLKLSIVIFIFIISLIHILYISSTGMSENLGYLRLAKFFILISFITLAFENIDKNSLIKIMCLVIYINFFALFFQYAIYLLTGSAVPLVIPFLPLVNEDISLESINLVLSSNFRPGGLFMEPSHLSYFFFFSALFIFKSRLYNKELILVIIAISLFSTFSSFGFMSGLLVVGLVFLNASQEMKLFLIVLLLIVVPINIASYSYLIFEIPQIARLINPESVAVTGRLLAGQSLIEQLNTSQQYIGLGFGNFQMNGQVNGISYLRLSFGNIGLAIIFSILILYCLFNLNPFILMLVAIIVAISFFSALLFSSFLPIILVNFLLKKS
jgi:hypothetical protein